MGDTATPAVLASMETEAQKVMGPAGVHLVWRSRHEAETQAVTTDVAVVRMRGTCRPEPVMPHVLPSSFADQAKPLGQTQISDGQILPFADVLCDAVREVIERDLRAAPAKRRPELLGRALGHVTAHELYHIMLHTTTHAHSGLARPEQTSSELLSDTSSFTEQVDRELAGVSHQTEDEPTDVGP
jgi:hypothetical protein